MEVILRGVRGSIANASMETVFYGGHTACIEVLTANGTLLIFDAGTGLFQLNDALPEKKECHLFISHGHIDHILGLGFFAPLHDPHWTTHIYAPKWLNNIPEQLFGGNLFPVPFALFRGNIIWHSLEARSINSVGGADSGIRVEVFDVNHPGKGFAYKLSADNACFLYSGDHEITSDPAIRQNTVDMLRDTDLAVVDAMYSKSDYRADWGHSTREDWIALASEANARALVLSHHDPARSDRELDALQRHLSENEHRPFVYVAREGMRFTPPATAPFVVQCSDWLTTFLDELSRYPEENALLDRILTKTREVTTADAGTVFLVEGNELVFAYTHNDSLFGVDTAYRESYVSLRLPISEESIAGYVASTGKTLNLPDMKALPPGAPYHFNEAFDKSTGYKTRSMLTLPFLDRTGKVTGVLQLINSIEPRTSNVRAFSIVMAEQVKTLAREAASILERSALLRKNIYSMLRMASIHDPTETGPHVERVGSIAAELYHRWASRKGESADTIRYEKSRIRLASMLHDIGKVGISDLVLKKNGKLTDDEYKIMRAHTRLGSEILSEESDDITELSRQVALHHHQKWNGTGYISETDEGQLSGEDIPLIARITAIADVFDALVSKRCYKAPWSFEKAMDLLREESGKHFDPLLVECMVEISDMLHLIYSRFPEHAMAETAQKNQQTS